jgi:hypothetical protein
MMGANPITTSMSSLGILSLSSGESFHDLTLYGSMIGAFLYLTLTKLDLTYVVSKVYQFMHLLLLITRQQ